jgi:capsular polysaccharide biosynthesis protein
VNDKDQLVAPELNGFSVRYDPTWLEHDSSATENQPADFVGDLVSLRYIKAALRRGIRLWCALAIVFMLVGIGYKAEFPAPHQASTTILLPQDEQDAGAILTDVALAQSRAVAGLAVRKLGLTQSAASFSGTYTVTATTGEVLVITATGPSATEAVRRANALADVFLTFRANLQVTEQKITVAVLDQELSQAREQIRSLNKQISDLSLGAASAANQARLGDLRTQLGQANDALATANGGILSAQQQTTLQLKGSKVLDPAAAIPKSRKKPLVVTAAIGLFAGLILGMGILTIRAVVSDRLRQRDDVASALGAPVRLSVGRIRSIRWLPGRPALAAAGSLQVRRVVTHLRQAVNSSSDRPAALAVVAVDDLRAAALCVASLAVSYAQEGTRVVVADLAAGCPAARMLGARKPGVVSIGERGARMIVSVPDPMEPMPVGPRRPALGPLARPAPAGDLAAAYAKADLLLVLASLDPAQGAEHLATWAADVVAFVTAGRSSWTRIHAVAEMVRLAHLRLSSAVLVGADKSDESIGVLRPERSGLTGEAPRQRAPEPFGS